MARQREFNKEEVLEQAMMVFWVQGYEATSVRDLQAATGISSSSMYEAFGDKRRLFLATLARYCALEQARILHMANDASSPQAFVETLFASVDNVAQTEPRTQGSLAFNTMVEFGTRDSEVTAVLLAHYFKIVDIIADILTQAQSAGNITSKAPALHLAYTIISTLQGLATVKGVKPDFAYREAVTHVILSLLDQ